MSKNIILTSYFISKTDFQRGIRQEKDNYEYIVHWYTSIIRLKMNGIIFYDNLSDSFIKKYQNKYIKFIKIKLGDLSLYVERFIIYYDYLKKNKYDNIFMTDISDVWFKKDPFKLINDKYDLYVGSELCKNNMSKWMIKGFNTIYGGMSEEVKNKIILNAGIIGGRYIAVLKLLDLFIQELKKLEEDKREMIKKGIDITFDMIALNKIIYSNYKINRIYSSKKLHSPYKKYLKEGDYCIFHK